MLGAALEEQRKEGEWIEGIAIWVAVAIVIMVGECHRQLSRCQLQPLDAAGLLDRPTQLPVKVVWRDMCSQIAACKVLNTVSCGVLCSCEVQF